MLASLVLLPLLGHKLLTDWDEGIYAEVSREMLSGGRQGWLVPHWNGQLWFEKPPLMPWITAAFFRVFGVTEFWARAGSALSGVTIVGVLHGWLVRREGLLAAWSGTVVLLCTTGFLHVCRAGEMDTLLSLGCVVALIGLAAVAKGRSQGWYFFWAGFAVAAMTKGAASVVIPLTAAVFAGMERWNLQKFRWRFIQGLVGFLLLVLPWHLAMWRRFGAVFTREYFGFHVLARATQAIEGHRTHWWYYGWVLLVSAMPWVLVFPLAAWRCRQRGELRVWAVFALVVLAFFSLVQTRLPHYVAPVYPALTVIVAVYVAGEMRQFRRAAEGRRLVAAALLALLWGGTVAITAGPRGRLHSAAGTGGWSAAEEREAIGLLRGARREGMPGPVLTWWTEPSRSVAASVFYSRLKVEQVEVGVAGPSAKRERYTADARSLGEAAGSPQRLILLETKLLPELPRDFVYRRLRAGPTMEVGTIQWRRLEAR